MKFEKQQRQGYVTSPTPLERCDRLADAIGATNLWVKRDDLLPWGGNKLRKLDYLFADALRAGADTVITASTNQCNHNLMTLMLANRLGMKSQVIMESWGEPSYHYDGAYNRVLYEIGGVERVEVLPSLPAGPVDSLPLAQKMAEEVLRRGGTPYFMPRGGAGPLGACGYIGCAHELDLQTRDEPADVIVCACGLGGMQAGLVAGLAMLGRKTRVIGVGVTDKSRAELERSVYEQCREIMGFLDDSMEIKREQIICVDGYSPRGYAKITAGAQEAITLMARTEGIFTDPTYSGKALAGLLDMLSSSVIGRDEKVVFLHSGGLSAYYDYSSWKGE